MREGLTPDELRAIVERHDGTRAYAVKLKVSQRIVQYWLAGERQIRPMVEDRIRELELTTNRKEQP